MSAAAAAVAAAVNQYSSRECLCPPTNRPSVSTSIQTLDAYSSDDPAADKRQENNVFLQHLVVVRVAAVMETIVARRYSHLQAVSVVVVVVCRRLSSKIPVLSARTHNRNDRLSHERERVERFAICPEAATTNKPPPL